MVKKVFKTILIWFLALLASSFFVLTMLCFAAPTYMANKFESVGMDSLAYGCYDKVYKQSTKVDEQYIMFNKAVSLNFDSHIVYYGERMINNENYVSLCLYANTQNIKKTDDYILENATLSQDAKTRLRISTFNEDNYIKNQYVKSLVDLGRTNVAKNFVFDEISKTIANGGFGGQTSFCLTPYLNKVRKLSVEELSKVEELYNEILENYSIDVDNLDIQDLVVEQRLCEISTCLSNAYKNSGNFTKSTLWSNNANSHYEVIYG